MADDDLQQLVQRRLFELGGDAVAAARRSCWAVTAQTIERIAGGQHRRPVSERLAEALSRALDVPVNRVRRAVGLPLVDDARADVRTGPHLRIVRDDGRLP